MLENNIVVDTDIYKIVRGLSLPKDIDFAYAYGEARVGAKFPLSVFFGLHFILKDHLEGEVVTKEKIEEAADLIPEWMGDANYFNRVMWETILKEHNGRLPLRITAVREGSAVPIDNVLFTMELTKKDPRLAALPNHIETLMMHVHSTTTIATSTKYLKEDLRPLVELSGDMSTLPFKVHDFSYRGVDNQMTAMRKGAAFLLNFDGSDTSIGDRALRHYYDGMGVLKSVYATEHSAAILFGKEHEKDYLFHQLDKVRDDSLVSIVIDSYDPVAFMHMVTTDPEIVTRIKNRQGKVIFRPDSGDPGVYVPMFLYMLSGAYGLEVNSKGYAVIPKVGLIWGDGMNPSTIVDLYKKVVKELRYSTDNLVTGAGGGIMVKNLDRDTQRFAIKTSYAEAGETVINSSKTVKTDFTKNSKAGKLKLIPNGISFTTASSVNNPNFDSLIDSKKEVFLNGLVYNHSGNISDMRDRLDLTFKSRSIHHEQASKCGCGCQE